LLQETLHLSVRLLDEFLEKTPDLKPDQLQLVAVTSLLLASKYEETYAPGLKQFVFVCDKAYTGQQVLEMEQRMLHTLDFSLTRALVILFLRRYAMAADSNSLQHAYSKYFVDLTLTSSTFSHVKPSQVAAAAIFITKCVMRNHVNSLFWTPTMSFYSGYTLHDFAPLVSRLADLITSSKQSRLTAVRRKYSIKQLHEISLNPKLGPTSTVLKSLCSFRHFDGT
jgi:cyclin B